MHQLHLQTCQKQPENTIIKTYTEVFYHACFYLNSKLLVTLYKKKTVSKMYLPPPPPLITVSASSIAQQMTQSLPKTH